ncbi:MAG: flagellar basal body rod C-terminal domain-containing protein [Pseudomonadota bacterium]
MSDIINIGRSGLLAARTGLAVTGENIANVETPGYARRDMLTRAQPAGGGVEVQDIRRAFDGLLADRQRDAVSTQGAARAYQYHVSSLEDRLLPGPGGIPDTLDSVFDALDALAQSPQDEGLRLAFIGAGEALATQVNDLDAGFQAQSRGIEAERGLAVNEVNELLDGLAVLEVEIERTPEPADRNPLLDLREAKFAELADLLPVSVETDNRDLATIRMGPGGPLLLSDGRAARLTLAEEGRVTLIAAEEDAAPVSLRPANGRLAGLADAADVAAEARRDFGSWAAELADEFNAIHATGLQPDGTAGGPLFLARGWDAALGALTRGDPVADVRVLDEALMPDGPVTLIYDDVTAAWQAVDAGGTRLGEGTDRILLPGLEIALSGAPLNGDRITLSQNANAGFFRMALADPDEIAAGAPWITGANAGNVGTARLSAATIEAPPGAAALADLAAELEAGAVSFVSDGPVGVIPRGIGAAELSAQARPATMEFAPLSGADLTALSVSIGPDTFTFTPPGPLSPGDLVSALNSGALRSGTDEALDDLGFVAAFDGAGAVTLLSRTGASPDSADLTTTASTLPGIEIATAADAAEIALFTRDGRQISGAPLSPAEAAALLRPENGFAEDAVYVPPGAKAAGLSRTSGPGDFALRVPEAGSGIATWPTGTARPETAARSFSLDDGLASTAIDAPPGASAAWLADLLSASGAVTAQAETRVALDVPPAGQLDFALAGQNGTGVPLSVDLSGGPGALAAAVNGQTGTTGIRAELSLDGARVELVQAGGADIRFEGLTHSAGDPVTLTRRAADGAVLGSATIAATGAESVAIAGSVTLSRGSAFSLGEGGTVTAAARDASIGGLVDVSRRAAGSEATLTLALALSDDIALREVVITGADGRLRTASGDPASGTTLAASLAADLRETSPASRIEGAVLGAPPEDGARMVVGLGSQSYQITMRDGAPVVEGPEPDRITARFDTSGRFVIETVGGHLDGAALRLTDAAGEAARFGMGPVDAPQTTVIGQPFDAANLPASFEVVLAGTSYTVSVSAGAVVLPPTFPGTGYINTGFGRVEIAFDAREGAFRVPADPAGADAGFDTLGAEASVTEAALDLVATDGRALEIAPQASGTGTSLRLTALPDEDVIVVLDGAANLRLAGSFIEGPPSAPERELRVLDAEAGLVGLFDTQSGESLGTRTLDAAGRASFGALEVTLEGAAETGDAFSILPGDGRPGDGRTIGALAALRLEDAATGTGGYGAGFAALQQDVGARVATGEIRMASAENALEAADRAVSSLSGVDLDEEAARMIQQQQAYQANAQVIGVARDIFNTLLQAL